MDAKQKNIYFYLTLTQRPVSLMALKEKARIELIKDSRQATATGILVAQIGKNSNLDIGNITILIWDFIYKSISGLNFTPKLLIVDCKKELVKYYEKQGFILVDKDTLNNLKTLYKPYIFQK